MDWQLPDIGRNISRNSPVPLDMQWLLF